MSLKATVVLLVVAAIICQTSAVVTLDDGGEVTGDTRGTTEKHEDTGINTTEVKAVGIKDELNQSTSREEERVGAAKVDLNREPISTKGGVTKEIEAATVRQDINIEPSTTERLVTKETEASKLKNFNKVITAAKLKGQSNNTDLLDNTKGGNTQKSETDNKTIANVDLNTNFTEFADYNFDLGDFVNVTWVPFDEAFGRAGVIDGGDGGACPARCNCSAIEDVDARCQLNNTVISISGRYASNVKITCGDGEHRELDFQCPDLPHFSYGGDQSIRLELHYCPVPANLSCVGDRFGATYITELYLFSPIGSLEDEQLRGLDKLEVLAVYGQKTNFTFPSLTSLPLLRSLTLNNVIVSLPSPFPHLPLRSLEVSSAGVKSLPPKMFQSLPQLLRLSIFANNIEELRADDFEGANSLQSLEMSNNRVRSLHQLVQAGSLTSLTVLSAFANEIRELTPMANLTSLQQLRIFNNRVSLTLSPLSLAHLPSLTSVDLSRSRITTLPPDTFLHSLNITSLRLQHNDLEVLPPDVFKDMSKLKDLDLSYNRLIRLEASLFKTAASLMNLDLDNNELASLPHTLLWGATSLSSLSVRRNRLRSLHHKTFTGAHQLLSLRLDHNQLDHDTAPADQYWSVSPFAPLTSLRVLSLSHNRYTRTVHVPPAPGLTALDMAHNYITELTFEDVQFISPDAVADFTYNRIETIYPLTEMSIRPSGPSGPSRASRAGRPTVLVDNNPFECDCRLYDFALLLHGSEPVSTTQADFNVGLAKCSGPKELSQKQLTAIPLLDYYCPIPPTDCAPPCSCALRPHTNALELTCPELPRNYIYPNLTYFHKADLTVKLTEKPEFLNLSPDIKVLNLSSLNLTELPKGILPEKLTLLDLSNNNLNRIPERLFERGLKLRLSGNPVQCDCWHNKDIALLKSNYYLIEDYDLVNCSEGDTLSAVSAEQLCSSWFAATIGGSLAALGIITAVLAAIVLKYSLEIRVWLYSKGCCARWMAIDDDDRKYDAFVSFCHKDEEFVRDKLIPGLETPPYKYKLCVHYRDWIPGEWIPAQIAQSVADSRRTIIVVSKNFLESLWGRAEFRAANISAIKERQTRVIVVLLEDITSHKELDPELKAYLSTNTYLKWGDQWFWDKMRYALPHKKLDTIVKAKKKIAKANLAKKLIGGLDTQLTPEGVIVNAAVAVPDMKKQQQICIEIDKLKNLNKIDGKLKSVGEMHRF